MMAYDGAMIPLPPKRFQSTEDPKYDPIRHRPWFEKLRTRRKKLHLLRCALHDMSNEAIGLTQKEAAFHWGVDERELRDYEDFIDGSSKLASREWKYPGFGRIAQHALDSAYTAYCEHNAIRHIRSFIEDAAPLYGLNPRHVTELWETDPTFWPTGYQHETKT